MDSIMHDKMEGLFVLSGLQGVGKSSLAFTLEHPRKTFVMDFDIKGAKMARDYGITQYHAPTFFDPEKDITDYDADLLAAWSMETLKKIEKDTTNVVIDNATALELGMGRVVEKNPTRYGLNAKNVAAGIYGGVNPGISILWQQITIFLQSRGVRTILMVNHMTPPWANGAPVPNRFHVKGNKVFRQLSVGTFILVPGETGRGGKPPLPSALVIKESLAERKFNEKKKEFTTIRTLPMRFPIATWPEITKYFDKPANFDKPEQGETWSAFEINAYGEFMSAEQLQWIRDAAKIGYSEESTGRPGNDPLATGRARLLKELQPHYKTMDALGEAVKLLGITYSLGKHDEIKAKLLQRLPKPTEEFTP